MNSLAQPKKKDYPIFYSTYLKITSGANYSAQMQSQFDELIDLFHQKNRQWATTAYEEGKWTPVEVVGHLLDTERLMSFRALCIARGEKSALPGFDQDEYVKNADFRSVPIHHLLEDFVAQRMSILSMLRSIPYSKYDLVGVANGKQITPRALLWIIPGHFSHHMNILTTLY
jgi:hypothetical protein